MNDGAEVMNQSALHRFKEKAKKKGVNIDEEIRKWLLNEEEIFLCELYWRV